MTEPGEQMPLVPHMIDTDHMTEKLRPIREQYAAILSNEPVLHELTQIIHGTLVEAQCVSDSTREAAEVIAEMIAVFNHNSSQRIQDPAEDDSQMMNTFIEQQLEILEGHREVTKHYMPNLGPNVIDGFITSRFSQSARLMQHAERNVNHHRTHLRNGVVFLPTDFIHPDLGE